MPQRAFGGVVVDIEEAVREITRQRLPVSQGVGDGHADEVLRQSLALLSLQPLTERCQFRQAFFLTKLQAHRVGHGSGKLQFGDAFVGLGLDCVELANVPQRYVRPQRVALLGVVEITSAVCQQPSSTIEPSLNKWS